MSFELQPRFLEVLTVAPLKAAIHMHMLDTGSLLSSVLSQSVCRWRIIVSLVVAMLTIAIFYIYLFIYSVYFYSASSSQLLLRGAPVTARIV